MRGETINSGKSAAT